MSERLTLQDLVDLLADKQNVTKKDAETFLRELVALISETIEGKDFVRIKDFGTFKLTPVSARRSVDVNTGDPIEIPAHYKLSFTPDKELREGVNRPFSHFESILLEDEATFEDKVETKKEPQKPKVIPALVAPVATPVKEEPKVVEKPKEEVKKPEVVVPAPTPKAEAPLENKVEEVIKKAPAIKELEKLELTKEDLAAEEELANINAFLTKEVEEKKVVEPLLTSKDSSVSKAPTAEKMSSQYDDETSLEDEYIDYDMLDRKKKKRNMWIGIVAGLLLFLSIGYWAYNKFVDVPNSIPYAQNNENLTIYDTADDKGDKDDKGEIADEPSTTTSEATTVEPTVEEPKPEPKPEPVVAPAGNGKEVEVRTGQTMRELGSEYYGNSAFWVYIFEENRDKIDRPDAVFAGMKLRIADPKKYEIDPNDKVSVKKARQLEMKLFGEFSAK